MALFCHAWIDGAVARVVLLCIRRARLLLTSRVRVAAGKRAAPPLRACPPRTDAHSAHKHPPLERLASQCTRLPVGNTGVRSTRPCAAANASRLTLSMSCPVLSSHPQASVLRMPADALCARSRHKRHSIITAEPHSLSMVPKSHAHLKAGRVVGSARFGSILVSPPRILVLLVSLRAIAGASHTAALSFCCAASRRCVRSRRHQRIAAACNAGAPPRRHERGR